MKDRLVCSCVNRSLSDIREAQIEKGVKTLKEVQEATGAGTACRSCLPDIEIILKTVCDCNNVSVKTVSNAIKSGATTIDEIKKETLAGAFCGSCIPLIEQLLKEK